MSNEENTPTERKFNVDGLSDKRDADHPMINIAVQSKLPHSGKTAITNIIAKALAAHGFDNITVHNMDGDFPKHWNQEVTMKAGDLTVVPNIHIDDTNGHGRGPHTPTFHIGPKQTEE
jgi:hypothetical protein